MSRLLFGMVNSTVEWLRPRPGETGEDVATAVVTLAFHGLRRSEGRDSSEQT